VAILLGLLVALSYGAGDFLGGLSSRRLTPIAVVHGSQLVGLVALSAVVLVLPDQHLVGADLVRGAASGLVGLVGLLLLYRGFAAGAMSIVAPITAVGAAVLPMLWGLLQGERPGGVALVGAALAVAAVALVSAPEEERSHLATADQARETALALVSGAAFGVVFILLADTGDRSGLTPVVAARAASVGVVTLVLLAQRRGPRVPGPGTRWLVAGSGIFDVAANGIFLFAAREGLLSLIAPVSSLYPATTIVLAAIVLGERVGPRQRVGLVAALAGALLIAL
jgi:drug/metabolite transporter (DMT)-like permease